METDKKSKGSANGVISAFDRGMNKVRRFFAETTAELGRCTWPGRSELLESTILVIAAIVILGAFVFVVDKAAWYFIQFISTGTF